MRRGGEQGSTYREPARVFDVRGVHDGDLLGPEQHRGVVEHGGYGCAGDERDKAAVAEELHRHQRVFRGAVGFPDAEGDEAGCADDDGADDGCGFPGVDAAALLSLVWYVGVGKGNAPRRYP